MTGFTMAASRAESLGDPDGQIAKLFEQAKEDFEHETHKKLSVLRRFDTVDDFIEQIRKEKAAFGSFREHEHPNLFRHIRNALKPIQILAKLFAGPSGNVSDFMSLSMRSVPSQSLARKEADVFSFKVMHSQMILCTVSPQLLRRKGDSPENLSIERSQRTIRSPPQSTPRSEAEPSEPHSRRQPCPCLATSLPVHEYLQDGGKFRLLMRSHSKYLSF